MNLSGQETIHDDISSPLQCGNVMFFSGIFVASGFPDKGYGMGGGTH